jgi:hypothetical protein
MSRLDTLLETMQQAMDEVRRERDEARREVEEQARLNGMGAEREAALLAICQVARLALEVDTDKLRDRFLDPERMAGTTFYEGHPLLELDHALTALERIRNALGSAR